MNYDDIERKVFELLKPGYCELSYDERARWGECQTCHAAHGKWCDGEVGIQLGRTVDGKPPWHGVHLRRLSDAPLRLLVKEAR